MKVSYEDFKDGDILWVSYAYATLENGSTYAKFLPPIQGKLVLKMYRTYNEDTDTLSEYKLDEDRSYLADLDTGKHIMWIPEFAYTTKEESTEYYNSLIDSELNRIKQRRQRYDDLITKFESERIK